MRSPDSEQLTERRKKLDKAFIKVEKQLNEGPYFKGDRISNVDIAWLPLLHRAHIIEQSTEYDFLSDFPKCKIWQKALIHSGLTEKSVAEDFEQIFTGFYLSPETYLGQMNQL